jgi:hypothetical protein
MRRGSWAETLITSTASPSVCTSSSACDSGTDPPAKRPSIRGSTTFPDYDTEPVMAGRARNPKKPVFDFRAHFCHSAPMETHAFGFRLRANAP